MESLGRDGIICDKVIGEEYLHKVCMWYGLSILSYSAGNDEVVETGGSTLS